MKKFSFIPDLLGVFVMDRFSFLSNAFFSINLSVDMIIWLFYLACCNDGFYWLTFDCWSSLFVVVEPSLEELEWIPWYIILSMCYWGEGNGNPLQYSCLENPMDGGAWWNAVHGVAWESDTTERLHFHFSLSCVGERNGNPLQCSCLENPRDEGAWWVLSMGSHRVRHNWSDLAAAAALLNANGLLMVCWQCLCLN